MPRRGATRHQGIWHEACECLDGPMATLSAPSVGAFSIVHNTVPGRARFHVEGLHRSPQLKTILERGLVGKNGIRSVSASPWTGNVLIFCDPNQDLTELMSAALESVALSLALDDPPEPGSKPPSASLCAGGLLSLGKEIFSWLTGTMKGTAVERPGERHLTRSLQPSTIQRSDSRPWHTLDVSQVTQFWGTSLSEGLSSPVARHRLDEYGPNVLAAYQGRSPFAIFADQFKSLPVLLLLGSAVLSIFTGGIGDAVVISLVVVLNASVGFATEAQAERTIALLLDFAEPIVPVIRDGVILQIHGEEVVPGDLLILSRGSQVAADARIVAANWLTVDESVLTGESMPVEKSVGVLGEEFLPLVQRSNMVFRGTVVTGGSGMALAIATGPATEIGQVQRLIAQSSRPETPMERQLGKLSNQLVGVTGIVAGSVLLVGLLRGFSFVQMLNSGISLAVAAVPEGLPVVATTALANAVHAMLARNVLVRRLDAIEALGAAQVVGLDKTGTLTLNRMSVRWVFAGMRRYLPDGNGSLTAENSELSAEAPELSRFIEVCALCNEAEAEQENGTWRINGSPTEAALIEMAFKHGHDVPAIRKQYPLLKREERGERRNYVSTWHQAGENRTLIAVKGSPGEVLALCRFYAEDGRISRLAKRQRDIIETENSRMADSALRVLGVAYFETALGPDNDLSHDLTWLGLVGMADPLREGLPEFIRTLRGAGIRPLMITGDQTPTARAVARSLSLNGDGTSTGEGELRVMDAASLEPLSADQLREAVWQADIFSRVNPTEKLRIVQALQKRGLIVAMTGDGINDGPALRAADIGITLGKSGTQVAREVADVVLRDDNIHTLIPAIRDGRRIHENIRKAIHYISATNMSEVLLMFLSLAGGMGQPLTARQLLWINVLTDVFPELALATQPAESDVMQRPPLDPAKAVITRADVPRLARQCGIITAAAFGCYGYGIMRYGIGPQASTIAFLGLAGAQLLHAFSARSEIHPVLGPNALPPNRFLMGSVWGAVGGLVASQFVPGLRTLLGTTPIGLADYLVCAAAAAGSLFLNELCKASLPLPAPKALPAPKQPLMEPATQAA